MINIHTITHPQAHAHKLTPDIHLLMNSEQKGVG
jgi:hypothetical protein